MNEKINSIIDSFDTRPYYQIEVKSSNVNFDIRVNDLPIFRFFEESGGVNMEYPINSCILHSGKQILTIKVLPLRGKTLIMAGDNFELKLNKKNDAWVHDNKREIIWEMPKIAIPGAGIPSLVFEYEFDVKVPFELLGWTNSKKIDSMPNINQTLIDAYDGIRKTIENKDNKEFTRLTQNKFFEESVSLYEKQEELLSGFQAEEETVLPFVGCVIKFYGNGRLVRFETEDGQSGLRSRVIEDGTPTIYTYPVLFHMPANSNKLEIIR